MARARRTTWKSDPRANNHQAVIQHASGTRTQVKSTRDATGGVIKNERGTFLRKPRDPYAITLVSATRFESEVTPISASNIISDSVGHYLEKLEDLTKTRIPRSVSGKFRMFGNLLYERLDTLRCATIANTKFYRSDCVIETINSFKTEIASSLSAVAYLETAEQTCNVFMARVLQTASDMTCADKDAIDSVADKYAIAIASLIDSGSATDCVTLSLQITIDLLHLLAEIPETKSKNGDDGKGKGDAVDKYKYKMPEPESDESTPPQEIEGEPELGYSNQTRVNVADAVDLEFNNHLDGLFDDYKKVDELVRKEIQPQATSFSKNLEQTIQVDNVSDMQDGKKHHVKVKTYPCDTIVKNAHTINLIQDIEKVGASSRHRRGQPTADIWQIKKLGNTKIFGKTPHRSGELIIMVDNSGSMGEVDVEGERGYLAYQVAGAIQESFPNAQTYGFNSTDDECFIYPIPNGTYLGISAKREGYRQSGNSDCSALLYMEQLINNNYSDSIAVIISDGSPASPSPYSRNHLHSHTKNVAHRLHAQGLKFVSVLVGGYDDDYYYPNDCKVLLNSVKDIHSVGEAIHAIGTRF